MATFLLTVSNTLTLDGRKFDNSGSATLRANSLITQTRDVDATYTALAISGNRFVILINKGEEAVYIRVAITGTNYFFDLPAGAHMVLPEYFGGTPERATTVAARAATTAGRLFIIAGQ